MSARKQLNTIYVYGILTVAVITGIAFGSWALILIAVPTMLGIALVDGSIRLSPKPRTNRRYRKRRR